MQVVQLGLLFSLTANYFVFLQNIYFSIIVISLTCFLKLGCFFSESGCDKASHHETKSQHDKKGENISGPTENISKTKESAQNKEEDVSEN